MPRYATSVGLQCHVSGLAMPRKWVYNATPVGLQRHATLRQWVCNATAVGLQCHVCGFTMPRLWVCNATLRYASKKKKKKEISGYFMLTEFKNDSF